MIIFAFAGELLCQIFASHAENRAVLAPFYSNLRGRKLPDVLSEAVGLGDADADGHGVGGVEGGQFNDDDDDDDDDVGDGDDGDYFSAYG